MRNPRVLSRIKPIASSPPWQWHGDTHIDRRNGPNPVFPAHASGAWPESVTESDQGRARLPLHVAPPGSSSLLDADQDIVPLPPTAPPKCFTGVWTPHACDCYRSLI